MTEEKPESLSDLWYFQYNNATYFVLHPERAYRFFFSPDLRSIEDWAFRDPETEEKFHVLLFRPERSSDESFDAGLREVLEILPDSFFVIEGSKDEADRWKEAAQEKLGEVQGEDDYEFTLEEVKEEWPEDIEEIFFMGLGTAVWRGGEEGYFIESYLVGAGEALKPHTPLFGKALLEALTARITTRSGSNDLRQLDFIGMEFEGFGEDTMDAIDSVARWLGMNEDDAWYFAGEVTFIRENSATKPAAYSHMRREIKYSLSPSELVERAEKA